MSIDFRYGYWSLYGMVGLTFFDSLCGYHKSAITWRYYRFQTNPLHHNIQCSFCNKNGAAFFHFKVSFFSRCVSKPGGALCQEDLGGCTFIHVHLDKVLAVEFNMDDHRWGCNRYGCRCKDYLVNQFQGFRIADDNLYL